MSEGQEPMDITKKEPVSKAELEPNRLTESKPVGESEHVPTESCEDDSDEDIEPLSGKPFFHIDLKKAHVGELNYMYQLVLPAQVARELFPNKTVPVSLTRGGRTWKMTYLGENRVNCRGFDIRWKEFAKDNKLKSGDVCIFELMESSDTALKFKVQVLRGDFPSALLGKQDGTSDSPIVVD